MRRKHASDGPKTAKPPTSEGLDEDPLDPAWFSPIQRSVRVGLAACVLLACSLGCGGSRVELSDGAIWADAGSSDSSRPDSQSSADTTHVPEVADAAADANADADARADAHPDTPGDTAPALDAPGDPSADGPRDAAVDPPAADADPIPGTCGYQGKGRVLRVTGDIELCLPPVVCNPETCPPALASCVGGTCVFKGAYKGLETLPEAWATQYCLLSTQACRGVTQFEFPEITAQKIGAKLGYPLCGSATPGTAKCVGIVASSPMLVGNSEAAVDPATSRPLATWGLGMTEASGICYEVTGPGGTAVVAVTDRCAGYCKCGGSGYQECGPCVNAATLEPQCPCVGTNPGLHGTCCGRGCPTTVACDWCASSNHPHFDVDDDTFKWICGADAQLGSCKLSRARFFPCLPPNPAWPPRP